MRCCSPCKADRSCRQATRKRTSRLGQVAEAEETLERVVFAESPAGCYVNGAASQVPSSLKGVIPA
jgi:hypothetical protein